MGKTVILTEVPDNIYLAVLKEKTKRTEQNKKNRYIRDIFLEAVVEKLKVDS